jgi:hypothetical protein
MSAMTLCPKCGATVRYIAGRGDRIFTVDPSPHTLINEKGRVLTGFLEHKCPEHLPWLKQEECLKDAAKKESA